VRLEGVPLHLREDVSLPSAGIVEGAVQLPPAGLLVVFGRDHPGTGGYPVVGVVRISGHGTLERIKPSSRLLVDVIG